MEQERALALREVIQLLKAKVQEGSTLNHPL
jgi:hypothetical protein